jgi:hypothetical protein
LESTARFCISDYEKETCAEIVGVASAENKVRRDAISFLRKDLETNNSAALAPRAPRMNVVAL